MGLENLKSVFTEGMKVMDNSNLSTTQTQFPGSFSRSSVLDINSSLDDLRKSKITDIRSSLTGGNLGGDLSLTNLPRIGSGKADDHLLNFTSGNIADYKSMIYDPRPARLRDTITPNPYKGTRLTQTGLIGEAGSGIGGLFNSNTNTGKYSTSFRTINSPLGYFNSSDGNDIIGLGNIGTLSGDIPGGGYITKKSLMEIYTSTRGASVSNLYFPSGESDVNTHRTIVQNEIPSFNNLTLGQNSIGTLSNTGLNLLTSPISTKLSSTSWEDYYNADHTPKSDVGYHYSAVVDRGKLNIRDMNGVTSPDRGEEPYIISDIGNREHKHSTQFLPSKRATTDTRRLSKFLKSHAGLRFFAEQNIYNFIKIPEVTNTFGFLGYNFHLGLKSTPQRMKSFYSPTSTLLVSNLRRLGQSMSHKIERDAPFSFFTKKYTADDSGGFISQILAGGSIIEFGPLISSFKDGDTIAPATRAHKSNSSRRKGFIFGLNSYGDKIALTPLLTHESDLAKANKIRRVPTIAEDGTITHTTGRDTATKADYVERDGLPFYFKDLRDDTYVIFRAYLDGITENISPNWEPTNYIGRSEPVYNYQRTERDLSFNLKLYAQNPGELRMMYTKLNRLTSMCYPQYAPDSNVLVEGAAQIRMKPPLTRLRIGDIYGGSGGDTNMMLGFIKSISYSVPDNGTWETSDSNDPLSISDDMKSSFKVPKLIICALQYQVIHETAPNYMTQFYGKQVGEATEENPGGFGVSMPYNF